MPRRGFQARLIAFPALYNAANAVYQGYMSLYWKSLGFSDGALGALSAAASVSAIAAQPIWGRVGDRTRSRRNLLKLLSLGAVAAMLPALAGSGFPLQMLSSALFYAFFSAILPLSDSILLEHGGFGGCRLAGGLSFALAGLLFGALRLSPRAVVWATGALLTLAAIASRLLPASPGKGTGRAAMLQLLKNRELVRLLLFLLPVQATMGCYYAFYAPRMQALGGSGTELGAAYLIASISEAPYLLCSEGVYRRFGAAKPMCAAACMLALRWTLTGFAASPVAAIAAQALHGGGLTVLSVSMARWIGENVPEECAASGQTLLNLVAFGASRALGSLGGGWIADRFGIRTAFLICAGVCAASALIFAPHALRKR